MNKKVIKCIQEFRVDYAKDPLEELDGGLREGYQTVFVGKELAEAGSLTSVSVSVPMDRIMNFQLSAGLTQGDNMVWFEGPIESFKTTEGGNGCGKKALMSGPTSEQVYLKWIPYFEGEESELEAGVVISLDEEGKNVRIDWSSLKVTNRGCLNGFVVDYHFSCETCDREYGAGAIQVPSNQTSLELLVEEKHFQVRVIAIVTLLL